MNLKYGNEIIESDEEEAFRSWYRPGAEFFVMMLIILIVLVFVTLRASTKSVMISESSKGISGESIFEEDVVTGWVVMQVIDNDDSGKIIVPLPLTARSENISVENYCQDHTLFIRIRGASAAGFENTSIGGDTGHIKTAAYREYAGEIRISLLMDGVWDFEIQRDNSSLVISPYKAEEKYENILLLVADKPRQSQDEEIPDLTSENITNAIAEKASDLMSLTGNADETASVANSEANKKSRIYVAEYRSDADILSFAEECGADMVIFLDTAMSDDANEYGLEACYNDNFFLPDMDNATLAESFLRNIAVSSKNRANSITAAEEGSVLYEMKVPAAKITVGYLSNETEGKYLSMDQYRNSIAEGIVNAVKEVTEK